LIEYIQDIDPELKERELQNTHLGAKEFISREAMSRAHSGAGTG